MESDSSNDLLRPVGSDASFWSLSYVARPMQDSEALCNVQQSKQFIRRVMLKCHFVYEHVLGLLGIAQSLRVLERTSLAAQ